MLLMIGTLHTSIPTNPRRMTVYSMFWRTFYVYIPGNFPSSLFFRLAWCCWWSGYCVHQQILAGWPFFPRFIGFLGWDSWEFSLIAGSESCISLVVQLCLTIESAECVLWSHRQWIWKGLVLWSQRQCPKTNHRGKKVKAKETVLNDRKPATLPSLPRAYIFR